MATPAEHNPRSATYRQPRVLLQTNDCLTGDDLVIVGAERVLQLAEALDECLHAARIVEQGGEEVRAIAQVLERDAHTVALFRR